MNTFAVVSLPGSSEQYTKKHPVLRHLPQGYANRCMKYIPAQVSGIIFDRDSHTELGYMLNVPGFFVDWDKLETAERLKQLGGIVKRMDILDTKVLSFPFWEEYLYDDEMDFLKSQGLTVLTGVKFQLAGLLQAVQGLLGIVYKDLPYFDVGIWGADTEAGQMWVEALAGQVNRLCIGGEDIRVLQFLSQRILRDTGLSCTLAQSPEACIKHMHLAILAKELKDPHVVRRPAIHVLSYQGAYREKVEISHEPGVFCLHSGWLGFPQDLDLACSLKPVEELGVLDALFYTISKVYREDLLPGSINLRQMSRIHALMGIYPLKAFGYIDKDIHISFDRFRKEYFRSRRKDLFGTNLFLDKSHPSQYNNDNQI